MEPIKILGIVWFAGCNTIGRPLPYELSDCQRTLAIVPVAFLNRNLCDVRLLVLAF